MSKNNKRVSAGVVVFICILAIIVGFFGGAVVKHVLTEPKSDSLKSEVVVNGDLSVHFLELGNNYTGDCTYIKAGDTDILIDAGSRQNSAPVIAEYVDRYCTDGVLEYVIATHAHQDHIAGFVSTKSTAGIFDKYECETIIDFAKTNKSEKTGLYKGYVDARNNEVAGGAKHYTALECWNETGGAQRSYDLTGDGSVTMKILYQKFYEQKTSDENDYSVCIMIEQGDNKYLFTGDLESKGEASLVESNELGEVKLFKGGHHGSPTSSTDKLLEVIKPEYVCVCCCAGAVEYTTNPDNTFPSQAFIDRIAIYTDNVYVTTMGKLEYDETKKEYKDVGFESLNGNIVFSCTKGVITVTCSNIKDKLKDTEWFKNNRRTPEAWAS